MTIIYTARRKRIIRINGNEVDLGEWTLWDFIDTTSYAATSVLGEALGRMAATAKESIPYARSFGLEPTLVHHAWSIVAEKIRYRRDEQLFNVADWWQHPNETWERGLGDCEDTTFLTQSAIEAIYNNFGREDEMGRLWNSYAVIGIVLEDGKPYGHAYVIYRDARLHSGWLWIETTLEKGLPLALWLNFDPEKLIPVYVFNSKRMYRIDRDYRELGLTEDYVQRHSKYINEMIEYVETGRRTTFKWMHKDKRKPSIARHIVVKKP